MASLLPSPAVGMTGLAAGLSLERAVVAMPAWSHLDVEPTVPGT